MMSKKAAKQMGMQSARDLPAHEAQASAQSALTLYSSSACRTPAALAEYIESARVLACYSFEADPLLHLSWSVYLETLEQCIECIERDSDWSLA